MQQLADRILEHNRVLRRSFQQGQDAVRVIDPKERKLEETKARDEIVEALESLVSDLSRATFDLEASLESRACYLIDFRKDYLPYGIIHFRTKELEGLFKLYTQVLLDFADDLVSDDRKVRITV